MNDPSDPGLPGRVEEYQSVSDRIRDGEELVVESDPVGVDKDIDAAKCFREGGRVVEIKGESPYPVVKWVVPIQRVCQRDYVVPVVEESLRDVFARIAECACYRTFHLVSLRLTLRAVSGFVGIDLILACPRCVWGTLLILQTSYNIMQFRVHLIYLFASSCRQADAGTADIQSSRNRCATNSHLDDGNIA